MYSSILLKPSLSHSPNARMLAQYLVISKVFSGIICQHEEVRSSTVSIYCLFCNILKYLFAHLSHHNDINLFSCRKHESSAKSSAKTSLNWSHRNYLQKINSMINKRKNIRYLQNFS